MYFFGKAIEMNAIVAALDEKQCNDVSFAYIGEVPPVYSALLLAKHSRYVEALNVIFAERINWVLEQDTAARKLLTSSSMLWRSEFYDF